MDAIYTYIKYTAMNNNTNLQPAVVFECFAEVNKVPRPSKKEEKMIAFLQDFAAKHGLPV